MFGFVPRFVLIVFGTAEAASSTLGAINVDTLWLGAIIASTTVHLVLMIVLSVFFYYYL